ncbi:hypothetical protein C2S51_027010 [Perilla frutescens var. frutescens]|nr:hypothetical protein C2S51_027010 [Perilla frutescens var. frutescens]
MPRNARNTPSSTVHICLQLFARLNTASTSAFQFLVAFFISATAFQFPGAISGHFNAAFHTYLSHFSRIQFITHSNQIITSTIHTLQTFLQLKYQGTNGQSKSPFATHPRAMRAAVTSSAVYYLACTAVLRLPPRHFSFLARHLLVSSGNIAVASLASVMLPDKAAPFVYSIFGFISAAELLFWLLRKLIAEFWIERRRFRRFSNNISGNLGNSSEHLMRRIQV